MPLYGSQATSNSQLNSISPQDVAPVIVMNAEVFAAGQCSLAVAIAPFTLSSGPRLVSFVFKCPGGIGAGVFEIQEADLDSNLEYTSLSFGGVTPGLVNAAAMTSPAPFDKVTKVTLQVRARFVRVLCVTAPGAAVTVEVSG